VQTADYNQGGIKLRLSPLQGGVGGRNLFAIHYVNQKTYPQEDDSRAILQTQKYLPRALKFRWTTLAGRKEMP